jgi:hypothetical protein
MTPRHRFVLALLSLPLAVALTACGGGGQSADNAAGTSSATRDSVAGSTGAKEPATADGSVAKPVADQAIQRAVIATAGLRLTAKDLAGVRQDAINVATGLGGQVADEQAQSDTRGRLARVDLTLRVPAASFGEALDQLAGLGTVRHRQQSVQDVTTQVIDVEARVKAQRASVQNIERLLARANTIGEIMSIERELASRQADLDSLEQQQKYLADQTSLSTIQLTLTRPAAGHDTHPAGFVGGLEGGWHALGRTAVAVGTAVGAVLPFLLVLALVAAPVVLLVRRHRVVPAPPPADA